MRRGGFLLIVLLLAGCSRQKPEWPELFEPVPQTVQMETVTVRRVELDSVYCSGIGFTGYKDAGEICFFDSYFGYLYSFDLAGRLLRKEYGIGNGPDEVLIRNPFGFIMEGNGNITLLGNNLDVETHACNQEKEYFQIPYRPDLSGDAASFGVYSHAIAPQVNVRVRGEDILYGVFSENPSFNMLEHPARYVREARHIAVIDRKSHKGRVVVRGFPDIYCQNPQKYFSFSYVRYDILPGNRLLLGFEATPELYVCSAEGRPLRVFGSPGRDMDQNYLPVGGFDQDGIKKFWKNRTEKGYYGAVKVAENRVFRSYRKGGNSPVDGMQIYEDEVLIADVEVPKDFNVAGVNGNTVVSEIFFDEPSGRLFCYEFELE